MKKYIEFITEKVDNYIDVIIDDRHDSMFFVPDGYGAASLYPDDIEGVSEKELEEMFFFYLDVDEYEKFLRGEESHDGTFTIKVKNPKDLKNLKILNKAEKYNL